MNLWQTKKIRISAYAQDFQNLEICFITFKSKKMKSKIHHPSFSEHAKQNKKNKLQTLSKKLLLLIGLLFSFVASAQTPTYQWAKLTGTSGLNPIATVVDASGNI